MERIAVLGAGTMGHGIAQLFAAGGHFVALYDPNAAQLDKAERSIRAQLALLWEGASAAELTTLEQAAGRIVYTSDLAEAAAGADWVFEAAPEQAAVKQELYRQLAPLLADQTAVASNTSTFSLAALAAEVPFADRIVIAHFFNPAPLVPLVEVVSLPGTKEGVADSLMRLLSACGKTPILLRKDVPGFIANRLQAAVMREACHLLASGVADAAQIDAAVRDGIGLRWALSGPFEVADYGGLDIWSKVTAHLLPELDTGIAAPEPILEQVRQGRLGAKTGGGFYEYDGSAQEREQARNARLLRLLRSRDEGQERSGTPL
ncbi:MAG: 3-hydroxyacyl-CoA dehydrogenase family protein [Paenibacillaceae bacterium]|nr:3-hydroxyacyl-CoA dehydrogenase family protein [Paenibacillaceae bacterium]